MLMITISTSKVFSPLTVGNAFWRQLGVPGRGPRLFKELEAGFPYRFFVLLSELSGLQKKQLSTLLAISPATLARRAKAKRFTPAESDRLFRFAEILKAAIDLFEGDQTRARRWMMSPSTGLNGKAPIEMLRSATEASAVEDLIGRMEHGVIA